MKGSFVITAMCTIRFDEGICYVTKDGLKAPAKIKGKKYHLLCKLFENRNHTVTYSIIYETLWKNENFMPDTAYERMHDYISKLRNVLGVGSAVIESIYGTGYIFHYDSTAAEPSAPHEEPPPEKKITDFQRSGFSSPGSEPNPEETIEKLFGQAAAATTEEQLIRLENEIRRFIDFKLPALTSKQIEYIQKLVEFYCNELANRTDMLGRFLGDFLELAAFRVTLTLLRVKLYENEMLQETARKQGDKRLLNRLQFDHDWLENGLNLEIDAYQSSHHKQPEKDL